MRQTPVLGIVLLVAASSLPFMQVWGAASSNTPGLDDRSYREHAAAAVQAYEHGDMGLAHSRLDAIAAGITARRDADMARLAGWNALRLADYARSDEWFGLAHDWRPTSESAYGLALSAWRQGRLDEALTHAQPHTSDHAPSRELVADVLLARAAHSEDDTRALADLDTAARYRPLARGARLQRGWLLYRLGHYEEAADAFTTLYHETPDAESASGLFEAYLQLGEEHRLAELARHDEGPLGDLWNTREAKDLYLRKRFLAAEHAAPGARPALRNIDTGALELAALWRNKSGDSGLSELEATAVPVIEASQIFDGVNRLFVRGYRVDLDAGRLPAGAIVGSYPGANQPYAVRPTTELDDGLAWRLGFERDGIVSPYIELGLTPDGGEESADLTGLLGLSHHTRKYHLAVEAFRESVRDSVLSYTGIVDPYSGQSWGAVRRTGLRVHSYRALGGRWGIYGEVEWAELTGEEVADNDALVATLSVSRDLGLQGFDYFSVGPALHLQRYDRNLSHFTLGHGGYFSPESLVGLGASVAFLTDEAQQWMVRGLFNVGYQTLKEDASPFFPLAPDGRIYDDNDDAGMSFTGQLASVWRLDDHWQVGAGLFVQRSPEFDEEAATVFVRYLFHRRPAVFSSDLPTPSLDAFP
jgi:tetratricopeptide (TPR) repeat protein